MKRKVVRSVWCCRHCGTTAAFDENVVMLKLPRCRYCGKQFARADAVAIECDADGDEETQGFRIIEDPIASPATPEQRKAMAAWWEKQMKTLSCLRSGMCCKKGPCAFGKWDTEKKQCIHLRVANTLPNGAEEHECAIHDEIVLKPGAEWNPAFGAGCCMPLFNGAREQIIAGHQLLSKANGEP